MGYSFGGLQAIWMALHYPNLFSFSAGLSPSFWVNEYEIFTDGERRKPGQSFWFDIGTAEWNYYVPFIEALKKTGGKYGENIFYSEIPNGAHNAYWWRKRVIYPIMIFAGAKNNDIKKLDVEIEIITGQSKSDVYYQRLNPVVTLNNGIQYSIASEAIYTVLNPEAGLVKSDGRFEFSGSENLKIEVTYSGFRKLVNVKYKYVQAKKQS